MQCLSGQLVEQAIALFLRVAHGFFAVLFDEVAVNLPDFLGVEDRLQILHRQHAVRSLAAGIHHHLGATSRQRQETQGFEVRHLAGYAGHFRVGVTRHHLFDHGPTDALPTMTFLHGQIDQRAGVGIIDVR